MLEHNSTLNGKKEQRKQNVFPDGTPISEWFLQTKVVHPDSLGKNTTFPIMELKAIPISFKHKNTKIIDEAAANGGGVIYIPEGIYKSGSLFSNKGLIFICQKAPPY